MSKASRAKAIKRRQRQYAVEIDDGYESHTYTATARTPSAARYDVWLDLSGVWPDMGFGGFLKLVKGVRLTNHRTPYDYARERYGVEVEVGQRVRAGKKLGYVAEPKNSNPRHSYVYVVVDGQPGPTPWHPSEVKPCQG